ncbi:hypothetical protein GCM10023147_07910 [Tsukamurella soli]|uniref:Uncharacterized protein n=1 Tax=Tsukamurella soli TaxID=644556 RepID=A0ABP8J678_9ACTN
MSYRTPWEELLTSLRARVYALTGRESTLRAACARVIPMIPTPPPITDPTEPPATALAPDEE